MARRRLVHHGPRENQLIELLLEGCDTTEMAKRLKMARRTVKHHFNRLYMKHGLSEFTGIKRVKLAVMLYRQRNPL